MSMDTLDDVRVKMERIKTLEVQRDQLMDEFMKNARDADATEIDKIDAELGNMDPLVEFQDRLRGMTRKEIGGLIAHYFAEANHEGWDGYKPEEKVGIRVFVTDLMAFKDAMDQDLETTDYYTGSHYLTKDMGPQ